MSQQPCKISCVLSFVFIVSMIYMNNATRKSQTIQKYEAQLPEDLRNIYQKIQRERLNIYYYGYALGFILSLIIIIYNYQNKSKISTAHMICIVISTSFITNYFYYMLSPKTSWMLDHIKTPEQTKAWLEMYKAMQKYYHTGLVLGIIAVVFLAVAFRK